MVSDWASPAFCHQDPRAFAGSLGSLPSTNFQERHLKSPVLHSLCFFLSMVREVPVRNLRSQEKTQTPNMHSSPLTTLHFEKKFTFLHFLNANSLLGAHCSKTFT